MPVLGEELLGDAPWPGGTGLEAIGAAPEGQEHYFGHLKCCSLSLSRKRRLLGLKGIIHNGRGCATEILDCGISREVMPYEILVPVWRSLDVPKVKRSHSEILLLLMYLRKSNSFKEKNYFMFG